MQTESHPKSTRFSDLNLIPPLLQALHHAGYQNATPIQSQAIPVVMQGKDLIGQAQTGTGKTAAFLLPFMNVWRGGDLRFPQGLVLLPTRELAAQVKVEADRLAPSKFFRTTVVYGGREIRKDIRELDQGCSLLVGTPGRVNDLIQRQALNLSRIRYVVLDEADRMLDIGFRPQIDRIMRSVPQNRQTLLMSATLPSAVMRLVDKYLVSPVHVNVSPPVLTVDKIDQRYITVDEDRKFSLLIEVLKREKLHQTIIFVERKKTADQLSQQVRRFYPESAAIHGDIEQRHRDQIMQAFRDSQILILIATDVMSRGIDVSGVSHIINFDMPNDIENYVHRIGRTGRMGREGIAISFVTPQQGQVLTDIEMMINRQIPQYRIEGFEAFRPKVTTPAQQTVTQPKVPVFGRPTKKYSNRL